MRGGGIALWSAWTHARMVMSVGLRWAWVAKEVARAAVAAGALLTYNICWQANNYVDRKGGATKSELDPIAIESQLQLGCSWAWKLAASS
eukprot:287999-Prymnesium_polylepis.1